jgi:alpha(1,3/1,4) fucosyltransferase
MKRQIKIKFTNGLSYEAGVKEILACTKDDYDFIDSNDPEFIIFGPYGNDVPPTGDYIRIGYFCENMLPNMAICDWAFGVPYEEDIEHPQYMRIQWHGFDPDHLVKSDICIESILAQKTKFCNFIYSNQVPFRENFCQQLSKYKSIDCPGNSLNNISSIDSTMPHISKWERKRRFLSEYKFTIAFENYSYPGYNTEKLLDTMMVDSLPIYLGNPYINRHFNPKSFVNAHDYIRESSPLVDLLESSCRPDWEDNCPSEYTSLGHKVKRKLKSIGRSFKMQLKYHSLDDLIDKIIDIDQNDDLYAQYLAEPWFYENIPPNQDAVVQRWRKIFGQQA